MADKNIIRRLLDYDLTDQELDKLQSDDSLQKEIALAEKASSISEELLLPGYNALVKEKEAELRQLITGIKIPEPKPESTEAVVKTLDPAAKKRSLPYKWMGIAASLIVLIGLFTLTWNSDELTHDQMSGELKLLAIQSFESSGMLSGERGEGEINQEFKAMFELLESGNCDEFVASGKYVEQELWMGLYCAWVSGDESEYDRIKTIIVENRYPNYNKF